MADARVGLLTAESNARTGRSLLGFLTGEDAADVPLDAALDVPEEVPELELLVAEAQRRRPDVQAAALAVTSAEQVVELAAAERWPSLELDLDAFLTRDSEPTDRDWDALLALHLPIFLAGLIQADVRDSLSRLRAAQLLSLRARREARRDVEVALENLRTSGERLAELRVQLATAREALSQAEGLYDAGLATNHQPRAPDGAGRRAADRAAPGERRARAQGVLPRPAADHRRAARLARALAPERRDGGGGGGAACRSSLRSASAARSSPAC
jgi:outer membrane protein TolC